MSEIALATIYCDPSDFPGKYVGRMHYAGPGYSRPADEPFVVAETLEAARAALPPGLTRLARSPEDEPQIVETWI